MNKKDLLKTLRQRAIDQRKAQGVTIGPSVTVVCRDEEIAERVRFLRSAGECVVVEEHDVEGGDDENKNV